MDEVSSELLSAVKEIRDLVRLMAEPAVAERDKNRRAELRRIVGNSAPKARATALMDGSKSQTEIHKMTGINKGQLSAFIKQLNEGNLLTGESKEPRLSISVPTNFFENGLSNE